MSNNNPIDETVPTEERLPLISGQRVTIYKQRWLMLLIFSLNTAMNGCLFMAISPINEIVRTYYRIRSVDVEWLSNMCVIAYAIFALPSTYVMSKVGVRPLILTVSTFHLITTILRYFGSEKDKYYLVLTGQAFTALAYATVLQLPGKISSMWFPEGERATSTSIGVISNILGVGIGFLQPSMMIGDPNRKGEVGEDLKSCFISQMATSGVILIFTIPYKEKPPSPPFVSVQEEDTIDFLNSMKLLWHNKRFLFMSQSYGIYFAMFIAIFVLVSPLVSEVFPDGYDEAIGQMGCWNNVVAMLALLVIGRLLDKYKRHQLFAILLNVVSMIVWSAFFVVLTNTKAFSAIYLLFLSLGLCFLPYFAVGIEQAAEMTYPVTEEKSSSVILSIGNVYAFVFILAFGFLIQMKFLRAVGYTMTGLYMISSVFALLAKTELNRSNAQRKVLSSPS